MTCQERCDLEKNLEIAVKKIGKLKRLLRMSKKYIKYYIDHVVDDDNYDRKPQDLFNYIDKVLKEIQR